MVMAEALKVPEVATFESAEVVNSIDSVRLVEDLVPYAFEESAG